ncbi:MAG: GH25, partial [uncultured Rubrobacteraceae bacterium]
VQDQPHLLRRRPPRVPARPRLPPRRGARLRGGHRQGLAGRLLRPDRPPGVLRPREGLRPDPGPLPLPRRHRPGRRPGPALRPDDRLRGRARGEDPRRGLRGLRGRESLKRPPEHVRRAAPPGDRRPSYRPLHRQVFLGGRRPIGALYPLRLRRVVERPLRGHGQARPAPRALRADQGLGLGFRRRQDLGRLAVHVHGPRGGSVHRRERVRRHPCGADGAREGRARPRRASAGPAHHPGAADEQSAAGHRLHEEADRPAHGLRVVAGRMASAEEPAEPGVDVLPVRPARPEDGGPGRHLRRDGQSRQRGGRRPLPQRHARLREGPRQQTPLLPRGESQGRGGPGKRQRHGPGRGGSFAHRHLHRRRQGHLLRSPLRRKQAGPEHPRACRIAPHVRLRIRGRGAGGPPRADGRPAPVRQEHLRRGLQRVGWTRIEPDAFRKALHGGAFFSPAEPIVWASAELAVRALLLGGHAVLVDATNTTRRRRAGWIRIARDVGAPVEAFV